MPQLFPLNICKSVATLGYLFLLLNLSKVTCDAVRVFVVTRSVKHNAKCATWREDPGSNILHIAQKWEMFFTFAKQRQNTFTNLLFLPLIKSTVETCSKLDTEILKWVFFFSFNKKNVCSLNYQLKTSIPIITRIFSNLIFEGWMHFAANNHHVSAGLFTLCLYIMESEISDSVSATTVAHQYHNFVFVLSWRGHTVPT